MDNDAIDFYFFSGTGNTLLVVKKMQETFEKEGINVNLHKIEESDPGDVNLNHTIGIGFPVAFFSTYPFVWEFIKSMPGADGTEIFMVDTLGGYSGGIVGPLREIIKKKGYNPIGAKEIQMPSNIFYIQDDETNKEKVRKGLIDAENYAHDIINSRSEWGRVPLFSDGVYIFSKCLLKLTGVNLHQKWFNFDINEEECKNCGICAKLCPLKNIQIEKGKYPQRGLHCEYCLRCTSFCPRQAIPCKFNYKNETYRACKAKEFIK
ncbi:EFR1 family ferrodoxin [Methanobacterium sp. ACI-7]|uniref:EFR1 family ferrodoxin n=1 Tax=unclassified Methanobacterium TaxID=2627676 RepID=UPI0039C3154D